MKRLFILFILLSMVAVSQLSCGGGGGGTQLPSIALKTSNLRVLQPNDSWTYSISGTWNENGVIYPITGTASSIVTTSLITSPINNIACSVESVSLSLTVNNVLISDNTYSFFTQDNIGNYYAYGDFDGFVYRWITSPGVGFIMEIASPFVIGNALSNTVTYSNGDTESITYVVVGKEYVSTDNANYESFKVNVSIVTNYASGTFTKAEEDITAWVVPGLDIVKENVNLKMYIGSTIIRIINYNQTLSATNVPY